MITVIVAGLAGFITSVLLTPVARLVALRYGAVDIPGPRKVHSVPTPRLGGLAIYFGVLLVVGILTIGGLGTQMAGILVGATIVMLVGALDDRGLIHHQVKLAAAMPLAAMVLVLSGIRVSLPVPSPDLEPLGFLLSIVITVVWVVGITAAFSILDHLDGLCAGIAAVASLFFLAEAMIRGQILTAILAAAILGASLGFLRWNFSPAKIFMGDGGAMFLGFTMAALSLVTDMTLVSQPTGWMVPILILGVPIFDTTLVSISRARRGLVPFASPGKDHTAHRLLNLGLRTRGSVLVLYGVGLFMGLLGLSMRYLSTMQGFALCAGVVLAALIGVVVLERVPFERQSRQKSGVGPIYQGTFDSSGSAG